MKKRNIIILCIVIILFLIQYIFNSYSEFKKIEYIDRKTNKVKVENVPGESYLKFLYYSPYGKLTLNTLVKNKFLSSYYGKQMDKEKSKDKIKKFVESNNINLEDNLLSLEEYNSFNEFFYRKLKANVRVVDYDKYSLVSPADSKVLAFENVGENDNFLVKGINFDLEKLLDNKDLAKKYKGSTILIFRLAPSDYHRFHFPVDGFISKNTKIEGKYYSVSPHAIRKNMNIFIENKREYSVLKTIEFGDILIEEVGATMVGSIIQSYNENSYVKKASEKGYFKFGGSTVILILEKDKVKIDDDILKNSNNGYETKVFMGEKIGSAINK
ncbi:phosphatidylserine decarboxylase [Oceanivirga miroungae]|uniref:Phosphatidylserine decarboxylase proenzyme n=1 Tax=Oceanivirga miroungae TaxID=1130046 RepID=A0A6I8MAW5_9FUSO|nr:phosphatidylserine decarboxylase [Oceanivirga miroungae]VWL85398.1 Phosphatidylserine decarboxylase proenzyme [Oceanivirga miroungae]